MNKLLAAVVAGVFALSTAPAVLAAKHEMKKDATAEKTDTKAAKKKGEQKKMAKGEGKKTEGKSKKGEGKKKEK